MVLLQKKRKKKKEKTKGKNERKLNDVQVVTENFTFERRYFDIDIKE